jgi:hypothetical protein
MVIVNLNGVRPQTHRDRWTVERSSRIRISIHTMVSLGPDRVFGVNAYLGAIRASCQLPRTWRNGAILGTEHFGRLRRHGSPYEGEDQKAGHEDPRVGKSVGRCPHVGPSLSPPRNSPKGLPGPAQVGLSVVHPKADSEMTPNGRRQFAAGGARFSLASRGRAPRPDTVHLVSWLASGLAVTRSRRAGPGLTAYLSAVGPEVPACPADPRPTASTRPAVPLSVTASLASA